MRMMELKLGQEFAMPMASPKMKLSPLPLPPVRIDSIYTNTIVDRRRTDNLDTTLLVLAKAIDELQGPVVKLDRRTVLGLYQGVPHGSGSPVIAGESIWKPCSNIELPVEARTGSVHFC